MSRYGFRTGEWANLVGSAQINKRMCYVVEFPDKVRDFWVISDSMGQYEFYEDS